MEMRPIIEIARQELTISVRNRWTTIFAIVFALLIIGISYFGIMAEGFSGMQSFTRTSASLLNLVLYIMPLVALVMGTLAFTGDKGSTELLFSQPLLRSEVLLGKTLGVFSSIALSTVVGFAAAGVIVVTSTGPDGLPKYLAFVGLSLALALAFLAVSVLVAVAGKRKIKAFGISLFLWFFFVLFYDLLALGGTLLMKGKAANMFLFLSLFGNPVDMVRVATLVLLDNVTIFGAAGAAMLRYFGGAAAGIVLLVTGLFIWIGGPLVISVRLLRKQDI